MKEQTKNNIESMLAGLALFALVFIATDANATPPNKKPPKMPEPPKVVQEQTQQQEQTLTGTQETTVSNDGNTLDAGDVTVEGDSLTVEGDTYDIPVSTAYAPTAYSAMGCTEYLGFGNTSKDGSVSIGLPIPEFLSRKQKDCKRVDNALWLESMGLIDEAIAHRCETRPMVRHYGDVDTCKTAIKGATNYGRQVKMLEDELRQANARTEAAKDAYELSEAHRNVCRDSLDRCEEKAYGGK